MPTFPPPERAAQTGTIRVKSGRASRIKTVSSEVGFQGQRAFTAWVAATYAFVVMLLGNITLAVTLFGRPVGAELMISLMFVMVLMIPNIFLTGLIWSRIYRGDQV